MFVLEPQLLLIFNNQGNVIKTYFLYYYDDIENTNIYKYFNSIIKNKYNINEYNILKKHILLTQSIDESVGFIRKEILNTENPILLFSLFNNISYYGINENSIFNPFDRSTYGDKINSNLILYSIYPNICKFGIFCVIEGDNNNSIYSYGEYDPDINKFIDDIINKINDEDNYSLEFNVNIKASQELLINNSINFISNIQKDKNPISIIKNINNEYYSSGNFLVYFTTKNHNMTILFYNNNEFDNSEYNDEVIGQLIDKNLKIFDYNNDFVQNLDNTLLSKFIINKNTIFKKTSILMNISMINLLPPLNKYPYFLSYNINNRKNILFDRSKKINIIITKKKIDFISSTIKDINIFKYITFFLIGIQILDDKIEFDYKDVKKGLIYFARYCQGKRKPVRFNILSNDYLNNLKEIMKDIYETEDGYHAYKKDKVLHICKDDIYKYIGFNKAILQGWNICYPCCYKKEKYNASTFVNCIYDKKMEINVDPYLGKSDHYRLLIDSTQIGALNGDLNMLFNKNSQFIKTTKYLTKKNKDIEKYIETYIKSNNISSNTLNNYKNKKLQYIKIDHEDEFSFIELNINGTFKILNKSKEKEPKTSINILQDNYEKLKIFDSFILLNLRNRIELAKNYVIYVANFTLPDVDNYWDIDDNNIYFIKDDIVFSNVLKEKYLKGKIKLEDINLYLVIQKKIHEFKIINRTPTSNIILSDINPTFKKKIINIILNIKSFLLEKTYGDFTSKDNLFFYKNKYIDLKINTKYFLNYENLTLDNKTLGIFFERFYQPYFNTLYTKTNKKDLIKTWFINNFILMYNNLNLNALANTYLENNFDEISDLLYAQFNYFYLEFEEHKINI